MSELATLCEGQTLMIGGKEVEVMGVISVEDFSRGRCFQEVQVEKDEPRSAPPPGRCLPSKPFCPPTMVSQKGHMASKPEEEQTCKPRYDPLAPGKKSLTRFYHNQSCSVYLPTFYTLTLPLRCSGNASTVSQPPVV